MFGLKGMTWNSEGFRDPGKHLFVKESIREYELDFLALLEIGRSNFSTPFFTEFSGRQGFYLVLFTATWAVRGFIGWYQR
jgi:hypothetical protein